MSPRCTRRPGMSLHITINIVEQMLLPDTFPWYEAVGQSQHERPWKHGVKLCREIKERRVERLWKADCQPLLAWRPVLCGGMSLNSCWVKLALTPERKSVATAWPASVFPSFTISSLAFLWEPLVPHFLSVSKWWGWPPLPDSRQGWVHNPGLAN